MRSALTTPYLLARRSSVGGTPPPLPEMALVRLRCPPRWERRGFGAIGAVRHRRSITHHPLNRHRHFPPHRPYLRREGRLLEGRPLLSQRWRWFVFAALRAGRGGGQGRLVQFVIDTQSPISRLMAIDTLPSPSPTNNPHPPAQRLREGDAEGVGVRATRMVGGAVTIQMLRHPRNRDRRIIYSRHPPIRGQPPIVIDTLPSPSPTNSPHPPSPRLGEGPGVRAMTIGAVRHRHAITHQHPVAIDRLPSPSPTNNPNPSTPRLGEGPGVRAHDD